jgi:uncharacterized protein YutE (UPF0331/DUF86 family)
MNELAPISAAIDDIERFFSDMRAMGTCDKSSWSDRRNFYAASMILFATINRAIDLANELIVLEKWEEPYSYAEAFRILRDKNVIEAELSERLIALTRLRNFLAHEYHRARERDLEDACELIEAVREFVTSVQRFISKREEAHETFDD